MTSVAKVRSRDTELVESYPLQVVTDLLGNPPNVAMRHYLMTTDEHFAAAVKANVPATEGAGDKAAQNAAHHTHVSRCGE